MEMLIVIVILAILTGISIPAFIQITQSQELTNSGARLIDDWKSDRQSALTLNRPVQIRLFHGTPLGNGYQSVLLNQDGTVDRPLRPFKKISNNITFLVSSNYSTLISESFDLTTGVATIQGNSLNYTAFTFRPDGSTDLLPTTAGGESWHLTLINRNTTGTILPENFLTIQIDSQTGSTTSYRP